MNNVEHQWFRVRKWGAYCFFSPVVCLVEVEHMTLPSCLAVSLWGGSHQILQCFVPRNMEGWYLVYMFCLGMNLCHVLCGMERQTTTLRNCKGTRRQSKFDWWFDIYECDFCRHVMIRSLETCFAVKMAVPWRIQNRMQQNCQVFILDKFATLRHCF